MRILWHSVAPWVKTGYGIQTDLFTQRLARNLNHEVAVYAYSGIESGTLKIDNRLILPRLPSERSRVGDYSLKSHAQHWDAELVITLTDIWAISPDQLTGLPWVPWFPIDHDPIPPRVLNLLRAVNTLPMVFSKFAVQQLEQQDIDCLYIPHGCHPLYLQDISRPEVRKETFALDEHFLVGMVGINNGYPSRKALPEAIHAFKRFRQDVPNAVLYLHIDPMAPGGIDLQTLLNELPEDSYLVPSTYEYQLGFSETYMRDLYASFDVLLSPSMGEGFGVPIIEAQALGTPVIVSDFTAMTENCFFGELVTGLPFYTSQNSYQLLPSVDSIVDALHKVHNYSPQEFSDNSALAIQKIRQLFNPDQITEEYWGPALIKAHEFFRSN